MTFIQKCSCIRRVLLCIFPILISACGHDQIRSVNVEAESAQVNSDNRISARKSVTQPIGRSVAAVALRQVGVPYRYGGTTAAGFDCSGLAQFAYAESGKRIPRTTSAQWRGLKPVPRDSMQTGDLLFFQISGKISHVGVYLGDRRFVHAPATGRRVSIESLDADFYKNAFVRAGRPL